MVVATGQVVSSILVKYVRYSTSALGKCRSMCVNVPQHIRQCLYKSLTNGFPLESLANVKVLEQTNYTDLEFVSSVWSSNAFGHTFCHLHWASRISSNTFTATVFSAGWLSIFKLKVK